MNRMQARTAIVLSLFILPAQAEHVPLSLPSNAVILTVTGNISRTNVRDQAHLDRSMLDALPQHQIDTHTPWTEGQNRFQGVQVASLLQHLGADGQYVTVQALDDFTARIPLADLKKYNALLALKKDGKVMSIRQKGPLWLIFPLKRYPEIDQAVYHDRMVWQLNSIDVR